MPTGRSVRVAGLLLGLVLTGCSAATSGHVGLQAPTYTPTGSTSAPPPAPSAWPSTLSPVAMVGSQVYDDHGHHDSGVRDVATYVNTRGGLVVADRDGTVAFQKADSETQRWDFYSCDLVTARCHLAVSVRPRHLVAPGGWSPPAD